MPPPPGWTPVDAGAREKNWQGSISLILAVIGLGMVGLFFGILGLKSAKAGRANNRGMALAGTILGGLSFVAIPILVVLSLTTNLLAPSIQPNDLNVGDCVQRTGLATSGEPQQVAGVKTASCERAHYGEVFYQGALTGTVRPNQTDLSADVSDRCFAQVPSGVPSSDDLYIEFFYPSADSWQKGDRSFTCVIVSEGDPLVGHLVDTP